MIVERWRDKRRYREGNDRIEKRKNGRENTNHLINGEREEKGE